MLLTNHSLLGAATQEQRPYSLFFIGSLCNSLDSNSIHSSLDLVCCNLLALGVHVRRIMDEGYGREGIILDSDGIDH